MKFEKNHSRAKILFRRIVSVMSILFVPFMIFGQEETTESIGPQLTKTFEPTYQEFTPEDSVRQLAVKLGSMKGRKLIFYDDFSDNRNCWSYYSSFDDSLLQECNGFAGAKICRSNTGSYIDAYTNMEGSKKVLFAFTPDIKYSNNVPVPLARNYVVTFNPLSVKQVSKLPSFYYEGFCEHTIRVQNSMVNKSLIIETNIEKAIGSWGLVFGNKMSTDATYFFNLKPDNTFELQAIYPGNRSEPVSLMKGTLETRFENINKVAIHITRSSKAFYTLGLMVNDEQVGQMNISRLQLGSLDVGYRLEHNSIGGNNILIAYDIGVYEKVSPTYLSKSVNFSGEWKGVLMRNKKKLYDVDLSLTENSGGSIFGNIRFVHHKFKSTVITKEFKAHRHEHIINFEDREKSVSGIYNDVVDYSILQMGNMEVITPDSMVMQAFATNNLHLFGEFDPEFDIHSNRIYLSRVEKTLTKSKISISPENENPTVEVTILFEPGGHKISNDKNNTENLDALARGLHQYLAQNPGKVILIHGHTDIGIQQLMSLIRAEKVRSELIKRGIPSTIFCIGHGSSARGYEWGDARNRRVEVELLNIDSAKFHKDNIVMSEKTSAYFINSMPEEFDLVADFKQLSGKHAILLKNSSGGVFRQVIPNSQGGERQSLRITKRQDPEEGLIIELNLDDVRILRQTASNYQSFGFEAISGNIEIENINIFTPQ